MRGKVLCFIIVSAWLGSRAQDFEVATIEKLNSNVNSGCEEVLPLRSPGGKKLFFVRTACASNIGGMFTGGDIWVSNQVNVSDWARSVNEGYVSNDKSNSAVVGMSKDGNTIYISKTAFNERIKGIYVSEKMSTGWSKPELIPVPFLASREFFGIYVSPEFDLMFISMTGDDSRGEEDLYVSTRDGEGEWTEPINLGSTINTGGYEISPYLTADKKRLYFSSNGHEGMGNADIFYSDRLDDSWKRWSLPVNMGDKINSEKFDAYFTRQDTVAYFSSNRASQYSDIYQVTFKKPVVSDSMDDRIKRIVGEAQTILADLQGNGLDKANSDTGPIFVNFNPNSVEIDSKLSTQLNQIVEQLKLADSKSITLVAHLSDLNNENQDDDLWHLRLEALKDYIEPSLPEIQIDFELNKHGEQEWDRKSGTIEIRH